jgi:hypothetical protein
MLQYCSIVVLLSAGLVLAGCQKTKEEPPAAKPTTGATQPEKPAASTAMNKVCPVSGEPVGAGGTTVSFQGHTVGFCCDDCIATWNSKTDEEKLAFVTKQAAGS